MIKIHPNLLKSIQNGQIVDFRAKHTIFVHLGRPPIPFKSPEVKGAFLALKFAYAVQSGTFLERRVGRYTWTAILMNLFHVFKSNFR